MPTTTDAAPPIVNILHEHHFASGGSRAHEYLSAIRSNLAASINRPVIATVHGGGIRQNDDDMLNALRQFDQPNALLLWFFATPRFETDDIGRIASYALQSENGSVLDAYGPLHTDEFFDKVEGWATEYQHTATGDLITVGDPGIILHTYQPHSDSGRTNPAERIASFYAYENVCFIPYDLVHSRYEMDDAHFNLLMRRIANVYASYEAGKAIPTFVGIGQIDAGFPAMSPEVAERMRQERLDRLARLEAERAERERLERERELERARALREQQRTNTMTALADFEAKRKDHAIEKAREEVQSAQRNAELQRQRYVDAIRHLETNMHSLETARSMSANMPTVNLANIMAMYDAGTISDLTTRDGQLRFNTRPIYIQDDRTGAWHDIGEFKVRLNPMSLDLTMENQTRRVRAYDGEMQHPHVFRNGNACLGSLSESLVSLRSSGDWVTMIQMVLMFLESANTSDPAGQYVCRWPLVRDPENVGLPAYPAGFLANYRNPLDEPEDDDNEDE